ncbi:hypothetical protein QE152_g39034 [Popillia japonica]|uniref:Transposase n=1 Tax=Popillia japonica TaxID=7064 RepID=A0AAW1HV43_POPJA
MLSSYKDVVHMLPVKTMRADDLYVFIRKVIIGLEDIGFEVLCVVSDNNAINKKAMSSFATPPQILNQYIHPRDPSRPLFFIIDTVHIMKNIPRDPSRPLFFIIDTVHIMKNIRNNWINQYIHPRDPSRPLFFIIDTVHIMKNIRNNWINQKPSQCMQYPNFENTSEIKLASFDALKQLHSKEDQLIKYGYSLTSKALYPTSIERQNIKLALQVFNHNIVAGLRQIGPKILLENYEDTAVYIELICRWWIIVNVKTLLKGQDYETTFKNLLQKVQTILYSL